MPRGWLVLEGSTFSYRLDDVEATEVRDIIGERLMIVGRYVRVLTDDLPETVRRPVPEETGRPGTEREN